MTGETTATSHSLTLTSRNAPITRIDGHRKRIRRIAFHPSGQYFATAGEDSKTKVWNLHDAGFVREFSMQDPGCDVSFSRDGKLIGTSEGTSGESKTTLVRLWDFKSGEEVRSFPHSQSVNFHPTLDWLGCDDAVRDLGTGEPIVTFASEEGIPPIDRVNFANRSPLVAARIGNRFGWRIDAIDQRAVGWTISRPDAHNSPIHSLQFSPDDSCLATGSNDRTVKLWEVRTGELITEMTEHANIVFGIAFHPKGDRLASASADGTVKIWEIPTGKHRLTLKGSTSGMQCVAFSPDGQSLVAGATDGTIFIWRAATVDEYEKTLPIVRERYLNTTPHR
jgi:WD40 repeat protein